MNSLVYLKTPFQNVWTPLSRFNDASNVLDGDLDSLSRKSFDISNESLKEAKRLFIDGSPKLISKYIAEKFKALDRHGWASPLEITNIEREDHTFSRVD
jgi:hypothetical protein